MMRITRRATLLALALLVSAAAFADPPGIVMQTDEAALLTAEEWVAYSDRVSDALISDNDGLREAALRMSVLYADNLALDRMDTIEMVRIFREHDVVGMRRLAVVALTNLLFRDARAGRFHPANSALTHELMAKMTLGIDPDESPRWG